nr:MAG TPA: hypothetical protein [Caudoviricetes sp.]
MSHKNDDEKGFFDRFGNCGPVLPVIVCLLCLSYFFEDDIHAFVSNVRNGAPSSSVSESVSSVSHPDSGDSYTDGSLQGIDDGRAAGYSSGLSDGEKNASVSPESDYEDGYTTFYSKKWLQGYIDGYVSQHPGIDEYELLDDLLYTFPDADISDLIDYLRLSE